MAKTQYLDYDGLSQYDGLIKQYINAADADAVKSGKIDGNVITLYAGKNCTGAIVSTITLPDVDLDDYLTKIDNGIEGNVVVIGEDGVVEDSGVALDDLATNDSVDAVDTKVGDITGLKTTAKTNVVGAVNEIKDATDAAKKVADEAKTAVETAKTESVVTVEKAEQADGTDVAKYIIKQNGNQVGVSINIPKDLVVSKGEIKTISGVKNLVLTLSNDDVVNIPVSELVDVYTASNAEGAEVTITISDDNKVSAALSASVKASLDKADSALQTSDITEGETDGTISVDGNDVKVHGLGDAAYKSANDFDIAGSASAAQTNAQNYAKGLDNATNEKVDALTAIVGDGVEAIPESEISALFSE